ncbi:MAG: hypothetical protein R3E68_08290 [Burkholderiaceae bacterium]
MSKLQRTDDIALTVRTADQTRKAAVEMDPDSTAAQVIRRRRQLVTAPGHRLRTGQRDHRQDPLAGHGAARGGESGRHARGAAGAGGRPMTGLADRRRADIERLQALARVSRGQLVIRHADAAGGRIALTLHLPTAGSAQYPQRAQHRSGCRSTCRPATRSWRRWHGSTVRRSFIRTCSNPAWCAWAASGIRARRWTST